MRIRDVQDEDFPKLLWNEHLQNEWKESIEKDLRERHEQGIIWLVAEEDNEIIGQIMARLNGKFGKPYIWALRVKEAHQNKGVGTTLTLEAENKLKQRGAKDVTITVNTDNPDAVRLYKRLNYIQKDKTIVDRWSYPRNGKQVEYDVELFFLEKKLL